MERHGRILAHSHQLTEKSAPDQLLPRLSDNESVLLECSRVLTSAVTANRQLTPAGEWLLDNFYLIDEQIRTAKRHFPKGYSRGLPRLLNGPSAIAKRLNQRPRKCLNFETPSEVLKRETSQFKNRVALQT